MMVMMSVYNDRVATGPRALRQTLRQVHASYHCVFRWSQRSRVSIHVYLNYNFSGLPLFLLHTTRNYDRAEFIRRGEQRHRQRWWGRFAEAITPAALLR